MQVDVRSNAIRENETFGIVSLALFDGVRATASANESRVVKLMPPSRGSPRSEDGIRIRVDLAISEVDETFSHFNLDGTNAAHPHIADRLCKLHKASPSGLNFL